LVTKRSRYKNIKSKAAVATEVERVPGGRRRRIPEAKDRLFRLQGIDKSPVGGGNKFVGLPEVDIQHGQKTFHLGQTPGLVENVAGILGHLEKIIDRHPRLRRQSGVTDFDQWRTGVKYIRISERETAPEVIEIGNKRVAGRIGNLDGKKEAGFVDPGPG
jgi:hypothetical protein